MDSELKILHSFLAQAPLPSGLYGYVSSSVVATHAATEISMSAASYSGRALLGFTNVYKRQLSFFFLGFLGLIIGTSADGSNQELATQKALSVGDMPASSTPSLSVRAYVGSDVADHFAVENVGVYTFLKERTPLPLQRVELFFRNLDGCVVAGGRAAAAGCHSDAADLGEGARVHGSSLKGED